MLLNPFSELPTASAGVILADPTWSFSTFSKKDISKSPDAKYGCMSVADIAALPVRSLANPAGCVLILWATAPMLHEAFRVMGRWGFTFKSAGAWAKQSKGGRKLAFGTGYIYRSAAEFWLLGTIGHPKSQVRNVRNLILAPVREHSRKPDEMRREIERQWAGPYIELFARERAPGWESWGNEVHKFSAKEAA